LGSGFNRPGSFFSKIRLGLFLTKQKVRPIGLAQNPGSFGLGILVYLVKVLAQAQT
jgi:hypothetical protein